MRENLAAFPLETTPPSNDDISCRSIEVHGSGGGGGKEIGLVLLSAAVELDAALSLLTASAAHVQHCAFCVAKKFSDEFWTSSPSAT